MRTIVEAVFEYEHSRICHALPAAEDKAPRSRSRCASTGTRRTSMLKLSMPTTMGRDAALSSARWPTASANCPTTATKPSRRSGWPSSHEDRRPGAHLHQRRHLRLRLRRWRAAALAAALAILRRLSHQRPAHRACRTATRPRIDQGERLFRFWINGGPVARTHGAAIDREALAKNEKPYALSFFPHGGGERHSRAWSFLTMSSS